MDGPMPVIELRNYLLRDGATGDFIRYFEEHFLFSQRETGMHVLGQFGVVDQPNRFVWVRAFESMEARRRGLERFYGGPVWQAHRSTANAMMLEHHDVHLLRP
jgi:NIPSNAP